MCFSSLNDATEGSPEESEPFLIEQTTTAILQAILLSPPTKEGMDAAFNLLVRTYIDEDGDISDGDEDGDISDGDEDGDISDGDEDGDISDGDEDGDIDGDERR